MFAHLFPGRVVDLAQDIDPALALGHGDHQGPDAGLVVGGGQDEGTLEGSGRGLGRQADPGFFRILEEQIIAGKGPQGHWCQQHGHSHDIKSDPQPATHLERPENAHATPRMALGRL